MQNRALTIAFTLLAIFAGAQAGHAAEVGATDNSTTDATQGYASVGATAGPGKLQSDVSPLSGVQISSSQDAATASAKISARVPLQIFNTASLSASVPLTANATAIDFSTLDTMANGANVGLSLNGITATRARPTADQIHDVCTAFWHEYYGEFPEKAASDAAGQPAGYDIFGQPCSPADFAKLKYSQAANEFEYKYENLFFSSATLMWGLTGKVGYQQYNYYDTVNLTKQTLRSSPYSFGGYFAFQPGNIKFLANSLLLISYQHQYGYNPPTSKVHCPATGASASTCIYGILNEPPTQIKDLITVDYRMKLSINFAFDLTPSYDARNSVWAFNAPIYLIGNGKDPLTGGLNIGWRSDKHVTAVGVFVSKAFSLAGN